MNCQFSPDRVYRYTLWRGDDEMPLFSQSSGFVMWIGLNPSTADETQDDPTIRRCINFTRAWGFTRMCMTNLFAYRATDPRNMVAHPEPVGPENDRWLTDIAATSQIILCAWGNGGDHISRAETVLTLLNPFQNKLRCLKTTQTGHPGHPLYIDGKTSPKSF